MISDMQSDMLEQWFPIFTLLIRWLPIRSTFGRSLRRLLTLKLLEADRVAIQFVTPLNNDLI